jgi:hypothetical protein
MNLLRLTLISLLLYGGSALSAQQPQPPKPDSATRQLVRTRDGSTVMGRVISEDSTSIRIETTGGVLTLARADILSITMIRTNDMHEGQYWFPDPNRTRLLFAPTGRMLDEAEGYYMNTYLVLQSFAGGLTNWATIGGGFSLIPGVDPTDWLYYVTPKVGLYRSNDLNVAVGAFAGFLQHTSPGGFGVVYGVATYGGPNSSITGGAGYGYAGSSISNRPVFMLGGQQRVSRRVAFISENYLYVQKLSSEICTGPGVCTSASSNETRGVVSYGLRFLGEKMSVDFAFFNAPGEFDWVFPGVPYLSFGVKF